jgi:hypothetical protein
MMRIHEFVSESSQVHSGVALSNDNENIIPNVHRVAGTADRIYDLNRLMMTIAMADGIQVPVIKNKESWAGRNNLAVPYSSKEVDMLKHSYKVMGIEWEDILHSNSGKSEEPKDTNHVSPVPQNSGKSTKRRS